LFSGCLKKAKRFLASQDRVFYSESRHAKRWTVFPVGVNKKRGGISQ
jgi:hypothetical protein